jgi:Phycobilisome protein
MHPELLSLLETAEQRYLEPKEIELYRRHATSLNRRLQTYETLGEQETQIFQAVADQLVKALPNESQENLERCLKYWLLIVRYSATAMLINDLSYLQNRLQDWVKGLLETYETYAIDVQVYELLMQELKNYLSQDDIRLLDPVFQKAKDLIISNQTGNS